MDPRHQKRIVIVQNLYAHSFKNSKTKIPYPNDVVTQDIIANITKINTLITKYAVRFPLNKIAKLDLAILQLAVYELTNNPHEPSKVIINEAVEMAKEMGGEKSYAFINAVLGKIIESISKYE